MFCCRAFINGVTNGREEKGLSLYGHQGTVEGIRTLVIAMDTQTVYLRYQYLVRHKAGTSLGI